MNNINESVAYHKNPRKITKKQHELLESSLVEFGDLSGIVVNINTGEVIGGNQRSAIMRRDGATIEITQRYEEPTNTGTVAIGYVVFGDEKFAYREVNWTEQQAESANIRANKIGGMFDFDILANQFDLDLLMESGFDDSELGFAKMGDMDREQDNDELGDRLDTYLSSSIKQIVLYFDNEQYADVVPRLEKIADKHGLENNTDVIMLLLKHYEETCQ